MRRFASRALLLFTYGCDMGCACVCDVLYDYEGGFQLQVLQKADECEKSFSDGAPSPYRPVHVRASMACSMGNLALSRAHPCHPRRQPSRARAEHPILSTCC